MKPPAAGGCEKAASDDSCPVEGTAASAAVAASARAHVCVGKDSATCAWAELQTIAFLSQAQRSKQAGVLPSIQVVHTRPVA